MFKAVDSLWDFEWSSLQNKSKFLRTAAMLGASSVSGHLCHTGHSVHKPRTKQEANPISGTSSSIDKSP